MDVPTYQQLREKAEHGLAARDWVAARATWLQALSVSPDPAEVMLELSYVESLAGNYRHAREWAMRASDPGPASTDAKISIVRRLRTFNEAECLRRLARHWLETEGPPGEVLGECARQLSNLNDFGTALACAEAAVRLSSADLSARLALAQLRAHHGRMAEAQADIERVLQRSPNISIGWWMLARLRKQTPTANHVVQLQSLLRTRGRMPADAAALLRALHKELDDIGEHAEAWHALEMFCRVKRVLERYDIAVNKRLIDALHASECGTKDASTILAAGVVKTPVFIVGMHRSGTTLMEQLLDASPQVRGLGELADFPSAMRYATDHYCKDVLDITTVERAADVDFAEVGQRYLDGMAWRLGDERFFTDKLPSNFLNIGFICRALPQAKIVHMVRDPVETCFSNLRELFSEANPYSYDQLELADYFLHYRRLMVHWHAAYPGRILDVDYAELTRDPEAALRKVAAFCGIDYVDAMCDPRSSRRAVATASAVQVREGVVRRETPKWAPYARQLRPLIAALRGGGIEIAEPPA